MNDKSCFHYLGKGDKTLLDIINMHYTNILVNFNCLIHTNDETVNTPLPMLMILYVILSCLKHITPFEVL